MALELIDPNADFSNSAVGYIPPISDVGLEYLNFFGGATSNVGRNLASDKPRPTIFGSPTSSADYVTFSPAVDFLQTSVPHTQEMTFIAIAAPLSPPGECPLISNFQSPATNGAAGVTAGASLMYRASTAPQLERIGQLAYVFDGGDGADTVASSEYANPIARLCLVAGRISLSTRTTTVFNKTLGVVKNFEFSSPNIYRLGSPFRICSGYSSLGAGASIPLYFAAIWSRSLTNGELDTLYNFLKLDYERRGISI